VGGVILNRVQNKKFPKTVAGVIYQPHAFESVSNGIINRPATAASRKAARDALAGWDPSGGALYFFNPGKTNNRWIWARRIINRIGKHVFAI
ncbi:MAG TPA: cell wall hydrolase, partial [Bacillota bacterium]|nr:cell wall hydrolase [Bacillota bacterium]